MAITSFRPSSLFGVDVMRMQGAASEKGRSFSNNNLDPHAPPCLSSEGPRPHDETHL